MKIKILVFFLLFFIVEVQAQPKFAEYKDPFLAGLLSWIMPGTGQIYAKSYSKGSIFVLGDIIDKALFVNLMLYLNNKYKEMPGGVVSWPALSVQDRIFLLSYFSLSMGFKIYNSLDAVHVAKFYNKQNFPELGVLWTPNRCGLDFTWRL